MHAIGLSIAIVVLPVLWLLPGAALFAIVIQETKHGGPWLRIHLPLNAAFIAWCVYAVLVLREDLHGPNSPLITIPRLLVFAAFYALVLPAIVAEVPRRLQVFRIAAAASNLVAFAVLSLWHRA